jgi:hypothetical protein
MRQQFAVDWPTIAHAAVKKSRISSLGTWWISENPGGADLLAEPYLRLVAALSGIARRVNRIEEGLLPAKTRAVEHIAEADPPRISAAPAHLEFHDPHLSGLRAKTPGGEPGVI